MKRVCSSSREPDRLSKRPARGQKAIVAQAIDFIEDVLQTFEKEKDEIRKLKLCSLFIGKSQAYRFELQEFSGKSISLFQEKTKDFPFARRIFPFLFTQKSAAKVRYYGCSRILKENSMQFIDSFDGNIRDTTTYLPYPLSKLPYDILLHLPKFLSTQELIELGQTSKYLFAFVWSELIQTLNFSTESLEMVIFRLCQRCKNIQSFSCLLSGCFVKTEKWFPLLKKIQFLVLKGFQYKLPNVSQFSIFFLEFFNLKSLKLNFCLITDEVLKDISLLPNLKELELGVISPIDFSFQELMETKNKLTGLKIHSILGEKGDTEHLSSILQLHELQKLELSHCSITDKLVEGISKSENLEILIFEMCYISDLSLFALQKFSKVQHLVFKFCSKISDLVQHLFFKFCSKISDLGIISLFNLPTLKSIEIYCCQNISINQEVKKNLMKKMTDVNLKFTPHSN